MKKLKLVSLILALVMAFSLAVPGALAADTQEDEGETAAEEVVEDVGPTSALVSAQSANAGAALLVDMDTDYVMFAQDADTQIYPASTTKILTALVVLQHIEAGDLSMDTTVTCSDTFRKTLTSSAAVVNLQTGEQMSVEGLLYCLMLPSACDAANVLGEAVSGDLESFGEEMNRVAEACGCTDSHFVNPSGLHNNDHYTTCMDLYRITKEAMKYETFRKIVSTPSFTVAGTNKTGPRALKNTNALLKGTKTTTYNYDGCIGIKTGSTYLAGNCLVSAAERDGKTLCCIMMGCNWLINRDGSRDKLQFSESVRLYDWGFENFGTQEVVTAGQMMDPVPVKRAKDTNSVAVTAVDSIYGEMPVDVKPEDVTLTYEYDPALEAPIHTGDLVGNVTASLDGVVYGTVDLTAAENVEPSEEKVREQKKEAMVDNSKKVAKIAALAVLLLVAAFLLLVIRARIIIALRRKRKEQERRRRRRRARERERRDRR